MRARRSSLVLLLVAALCWSAAGGAAADRERWVDVIVSLSADGAPQPLAENVTRDHGARLGFVYRHALRGFSAQVPEGRLQSLQRDPRVAAVEPDQVVSAASLPTGVQRIQVDAKLGVPTTQGPPVQVEVDLAILDTGIAAHPDLNLAGGVGCVGATACDTSLSHHDDHGHGTHVAGTAAARDRGGAVGVAPGARLWSVKVLDSRARGSLSTIAAGIDWVVGHGGIDVVNLSLGCDCADTAILAAALDRAADAGIVLVAAAGNGDQDASVFFPASHPKVIAVGALADFDGRPGGLAEPTCRPGVDDTRHTTSNYGPTVDLAAPGVCIDSTAPEGGYATRSGTSMASPHVAGAAALYLAEHAVPPGPTRWSTVRAGLQGPGWSVVPGDPCGYTADPAKPIGRLLLLDGCLHLDEEPDGDVGSPGADLFVGAVTFSTHGGPQRDRHLTATIAVVDEAGQPVAGATVQATLFLDHAVVRHVTGTTNRLGQISTTLNNALPGCYSVEVESVEAPGRTWDFTSPAAAHCHKSGVHRVA